MKDSAPPLSPELLLQAYQVGVFPMSEGRDDPEVFWVAPRMRGVFPLDGFRISRSLARTMRRRRLTVTHDTAFQEVVQGCADRDETWINDTIFALYCELHEGGFAHSIEVRDGKALVGGVYGVTNGAAFLGESMFSRATDASKIALAYLIDRLRLGGFQLFDTQFITPHLASLGAVEISRAEYHDRLASAMTQTADIHAIALESDPQAVVQRITQTS